MSAYFLTINPNISYKDLQDDKKLNDVVLRFKDFIEILKIGFQEGLLIKSGNSVNIQKFEHEFEIGGRNKFLHLHLLTIFKEEELLDYKAVREISNSIRDDGFKVHLYIKKVNYNPIDRISKYISKNPM